MGVGVAVLEDAAVVETEVEVPLRLVGTVLTVLKAAVVVETEVPLMPEGTVLLEVEPVVVGIVEVKVEVPVVEYMLRRLGPPQYSMEFPEHAMLHCVLAGVAPTTSAEPALMTFPQ